MEEGGETVLLRGRNFSDPRRVGRSRCWARFGTLIVPVEFVGNGTVKITTPPRPWDAVPYMDGGRRYANVYVKVTFDGGVMYSREALPFRYRGERVRPTPHASPELTSLPRSQWANRWLPRRGRTASCTTGATCRPVRTTLLCGVGMGAVPLTRRSPPPRSQVQQEGLRRPVFGGAQHPAAPEQRGDGVLPRGREVRGGPVR